MLQEVFDITSFGSQTCLIPDQRTVNNVLKLQPRKLR